MFKRAQLRRAKAKAHTNSQLGQSDLAAIPVRPRRITIEVPPEWLSCRKASRDVTRRRNEKPRYQHGRPLTAQLNDSDASRVLMGRLSEQTTEREG